MKAVEHMAVEVITPEIAKRYLSVMGKNRKLTDARVVELALQMESGDWVLNGETIKFDADGKLIDGQHRLEACILAGKPFSSYVAHGISDPKAFATINTGKSRTYGDVFSAAGVKDANNVSAAAWLIYQYRNGLLTLSGAKAVRTQAFRKMVKGTRYVDTATPRHISKDALLGHAAGWLPQIERSMSVARTCGGAKLMGLSVLAACHFLFSEKDESMATAFLNDLGSGAGLRPDDPVHVLREKLVSHLSGRARLHRHALLFLVFKAWNKRRSGERSKVLKIVDGEEFPKVM